MKLVILVFICSVTNPICNKDTARLYQVLHAPDGVIVCPPSVPVIQSAVAPGDGEFIRVRCELR